MTDPTAYTQAHWHNARKLAQARAAGIIRADIADQARMVTIPVRQEDIDATSPKEPRP